MHSVHLNLSCSVVEVFRVGDARLEVTAVHGPNVTCECTLLEQEKEAENRPYTHKDLVPSQLAGKNVFFDLMEMKVDYCHVLGIMLFNNAIHIAVHRGVIEHVRYIRHHFCSVENP